MNIDSVEDVLVAYKIGILTLEEAKLLLIFKKLKP